MLIEQLLAILVGTLVGYALAPMGWWLGKRLKREMRLVPVKVKADA